MAVQGTRPRRGPSLGSAAPRRPRARLWAAAVGRLGPRRAAGSALGAGGLLALLGALGRRGGAFLHRLLGPGLLLAAARDLALLGGGLALAGALGRLGQGEALGLERGGGGLGRLGQVLGDEA